MPYFMISALAIMAAFCLFGVSASRKVKNAGDYAVAGRSAGAWSVAGIIMGSLVAGGSTVGTVQMAYEYGLSGWWFTLGSGIGCLVLGLWFARPMRKSGLSTLTEFIEQSYGYPTALSALSGSILGTLLSVVAQFWAGRALLRSVFPMSQELATFILFVMILAFIYMGGLKSFSAVGSLKTLLLYSMLLFGVFKVISMGQGIGTLFRELPFSPWWNLLGRGAAKDLESGASLVVGVLSTQIYIQAIFAASDENTARNGCWTAAVLIPPLGLMAVWIGAALRNAGVVVEPALALPHFLRNYFPPVLGGALWASLAITVVGGAAGLSFGIATNLSRDIYQRASRTSMDDKSILRLSRCAVFLTVGLAALLGLVLKADLILPMVYLAMGLKGAGMVVPLAVAVFRPGLISPKCALLSSVSGLAAMLTTWLCFPNLEPLFIGLLASALVVIPSFFKKHRSS